MIATVVLHDGGTETLTVPGSGRFDRRDDGELFVLGTDPGGAELGVRYFPAGTWRSAWFEHATPDRPWTSISADDPAGTGDHA